MEKEYIAGELQRYEIGGRVFIVEPRYRKDGESSNRQISRRMDTHGIIVVERFATFHYY